MCDPILDRVKLIIKLFYPLADCGLFFSRNLVGDKMDTIYNEDDIQIDICYDHCYFEVFGLSVEEQITMKHFYQDLEDDKNE